MQIWSGLQGKGIRSSSAKTPASAIRRRISVSTMRCAWGSKPSLRPASWIGWKVTPRTQRQVRAWRTMSAISSSLTPFFRVTTRVVEMLLRSSASSASCGCGRGRRRALHQRIALQAVELQIDLEARHVVGQPLGEAGSRAMRMPLVLIIRWRIGRRLAASRISKKRGCRVGSPPENCTRSGTPSDSTRASSMASISARLRGPSCLVERQRSRPGRSGCRPR